MADDKPGPPPREIDWKQLDTLFLAQNNLTEAASYFQMHPNTLSRKIEEKYNILPSEYARSIHSKGKTNIKLVNYAKAMSGNIQMLIKLSEVYLDDFKENNASMKPANQDNIDRDQIIMQLQHKIAEQDIQIANLTKTE